MIIIIRFGFLSFYLSHKVSVCSVCSVFNPNQWLSFLSFVFFFFSGCWYLCALFSSHILFMNFIAYSFQTIQPTIRKCNIFFFVCQIILSLRNSFQYFTISPTPDTLTHTHTHDTVVISFHNSTAIILCSAGKYNISNWVNCAKNYVMLMMHACVCV